MTALCGGGISGPKAGVAETIIFTAGALASVLNNKGGAWALLAAPLLGVLTYQAEALCETDPPPDPALTAEDYLALLSLSDWTAVQAALGKLADLVKIAVWYEMCECKTVATPASPPTLFQPPTGVGNPHVPAAAVCFTAEETKNIQFGQTIWFAPTAVTGTGVSIPSGTTYLRLTVTRPAVGNGIQQFFNVFLTAPDGQEPGEGGANWPVNPGATLVKNIPLSRSDYTKLRIHSGGGNGTAENVNMKAEFWCGTVPGQTQASCCPPDPAVLALLSQILQMVTVTQRQAAPFGYVPAGDVAGLTGDGTYVIDTPLLAATVLVTTLPSHYGMAEGSPDRHFDLGWISRGTVDGMEPPRSLRTSPFMLRLEGHHTRIGYSLSPGVVATLRLHQREP